MPYTKEQVMALVGALASDIRGYWGYGVDGRLCAMRALLTEVGEAELVEKLDELWDQIKEDGRYLRDCWHGPYRDSTKAEVGDELYDKYVDIFLFPEDSLTDE